MPLSWNEIRDRAVAFSRDWKHAEGEDADAKSFSEVRYSKDIVYNNFPWPDKPSEATTAKIEDAAQAVLDSRAAHAGASLADLYDPLTMPPDLVKAHQKLDTAVDAAYGRKGFRNDAERVAFLFELYQRYTSLLPVESKSKKGRARKALS